MKRGLENSTLNLPPTKFQRRPGTDDLGRDYEIKITALLALRCIAMADTNDMWIGSNVDEVGDFDDVVVYRQDKEGNCTAYLMQLKHQEASGNIAPHEFTYAATEKGKNKKSRENFSLPKYSAGFLELKQKLATPLKNEFEVAEQLRNAKLVFILYTNKGVNSETHLEKITDTVNLKFLDTSSAEGNIYKFDASLKYDRDFLQQLLLFINQVHVNGVDDLIKKEIKQFMGSANFAQMDVGDVASEFVGFIKTWVKDTGINAEKGKFKIFDALTKNDIINKITELILSPYTMDLSKETYSFYDCQQNLIWNEIVAQKSVTIVDADDTSFAFLKEHIGSITRSYCNRSVKIWGEDLPKKVENLFCTGHPEFKPQMLKIVGGRQSITMLDIYKCLWFERKLPLLLEIKNKDDIKNIRKILKLSDFSLRVVVVNKASEPLNVSDIPGHFASLQNLNNEDRINMFNQTVKVQGRSSVVLKDIMDKSMYEHIKCKDIIYILQNAFSIGNNYESLSENFVPRSLSKVIFNSKALRQVKNAAFLVYNLSDTSNMAAGVRDLCGNTNIILAEKETVENIEKLKSGKRVVHQVRFYNERYFEWEKSYGSTASIRQHQIINSQNLYEIYQTENLTWELPQNVDFFWNELEDIINSEFVYTTRLIIGNPGMGKSVLLDYVACHAPANLWVLKIDVNGHYKYYDKLKRRIAKPKAADYLKYFSDAILDKYGCSNRKLAELVFQKCVLQKKVLILMDGFDEISVSYKDVVTKIAKCLHIEGYAVWLTSRPVLKSHLEEGFDMMSTTLKPFRSTDQQTFLTRYFMEQTSAAALNFENHQRILEEFTGKLLEASRANLTDRDSQFAGIPLQTKLLADVFSNDCKTALRTNVISFSHKFDLLSLYEEFFAEKNNILCEKFGVGVKDMHVLFEKHQQLFALKTIFWEGHLADLGIDEQLNEYYEDKQCKIQILQREGVLVVEQYSSGTVQSFNINFVHRTFAEFLAAQWLAQNFNTEDETAKEAIKVLLKERFSDRLVDHDAFLHNVFDRFVVEDCPLHLAIINGKTDEFKEIIRSDPESLDTLDAAGRSALHLIALYGIRHVEDNYRCKKTTDGVVDLIEEIPKDKMENLKDGLFDYSPLDYAVANRALAVANKMCEIPLELSMKLDTSQKDEIFDYCADLEYKWLFKVLMPYFAGSDLLLNEVDEDETVESYCAFQTFTNGERLRTYTTEFGVTYLLDFFRIKTDTGGYYYNNLCFASVFGTEDNVIMLLSQDADVNKTDNNLNAPIHYAVIHERLKILKILLTSTQIDVNLPGNEGNAALHYAIQSGNQDIILELLLKGADINQQNDDGDTPLNLLIISYYDDTILALLLSKGAKANIQNNDGKNVLHYAVTIGLPNVVSQLLANSANPEELLNAENISGQTPLYTLMWVHHASRDLEERKEILQILLDKGANIDIQDVADYTPLHHACKEYVKAKENNFNKLKDFYMFIVEKLVEKGANVNTKNCHGNSPLDETIDDEIINLLQRRLTDGSEKLWFNPLTKLNIAE